MNFKPLPKVTLLLSLIALSGTAPGDYEEKIQPLNVLFIVIDDLKPALGCYGDKIAVTPNIDRLAAKGTVFNRFYCQQAICGPSRANLFTGLRPDRTKVWDLATKMRDINPNIITMPQFFRTNGYTSVGIGKTFDSRCVDRDLDKPSWSIPYYRKSESYYAEETIDNRLPLQDPATVRRIHEVTAQVKEKGLGRAETGRLIRRSSYPTVECIDVPDNTYPDGANVLHAIDILSELSGSGKPFFFAVGISKPHLPFAAPKRYWDLYDREKIPLAKFRGNSRDAPRIAFQNGGEIRNYSDIPTKVPRSAELAGLRLPEAKQRELIHGYYAATSYADALVGKLLKQLENLKLARNTIVVVVGDHGWHLGDNNLWCKHSNFEQAVRSPLIVSAPGIEPSKTDSPAEFVDIFPTMAELAKLEAPSDVDGTSLLAILKDPTARVKDYAISQYPRSHSSGRVMGYSLRTDQHRYTIWMENDWLSTEPYDEKLQIASELYDYNRDPLETRNLVDDPEHAGSLKELRRELLAFFKSQRNWTSSNPE